MSGTLTLYTPGTGLPDFETRIALGLCAAVLNVVGEPTDLTLTEDFDRYVVEADLPGSVDDEEQMIGKVGRSLGWLCANRLANEGHLLRIPGFRPLHLNKQAAAVAAFRKALADDSMKLVAAFRSATPPRMGAHACACGHPEPSKEESLFGALMAFSPYLGQPPKRDNVHQTTTLPLCPCCAVAGLAGTFAFQSIVDIRGDSARKRERFAYLIRPTGTVTGAALARYVSARQTVRGQLQDIPGRAAALALLALHPDLTSTLSGEGKALRFAIYRADVGGNAARYGYITDGGGSEETSFLSASPYNRALVQSCYRNDDRGVLLGLLSNALNNKEPTTAMDFARSLASATESRSLLPWTTTRYLAKEVCSVDQALLDKDGESFKAIRQVADMLQFFVRQRNFGYVDNLRKARDVDEFASLLLDAQREAQSVVLDQKKQDKPFLPGQETIRSLLDLANADSGIQFRSIQTLLALMAFTYYRKES